MRRLRERVLRLSPSHLPVLLQGPSGSGKELVARALHLFSGRKGEFVGFNVAAIPDGMFEATLFGHTKGAFTGAIADGDGYLLEANGGTVFFDEIGALPTPMQAKLLRALDHQGFRAVGARRDTRSEFRAISATNEDINNAVRMGAFRADLAFRLRGGTIHVPPLRERLEDIRDLVQHFLIKASVHRLPTPSTCSDDALRELAQYDWPGNVRELQHVIQLASALSEGREIGTHEVRAALADARGNGAALPSRDPQFDADRQRLLEILIRTDWNTSHAARECGISRSHLYREMHHLGIRPPRKIQRPTNNNGGATESTNGSPPA
jgi:DNA-binding NtrC family response regulator